MHIADMTRATPEVLDFVFKTGGVLAAAGVAGIGWLLWRARRAATPPRRRPAPAAGRKRRRRN